MLSNSVLYGLGLAVVLAVSACGPTYVWRQAEYPSRNSEMYFARDKTECAAFAYQMFPDIPKQPIQPIVNCTSPSYDYFYGLGSGTATPRGGGCKRDHVAEQQQEIRNLVPDAMAQGRQRSNRNAFWGDCMIGKGWQKVQVPTETATASPNLPEPTLHQQPPASAALQRTESKKSAFCSSMWEDDPQEQASCQRAQRRSYDRLLPSVAQFKAKPTTLESKRLKACYQRTQTWAGTDWEAIERCFYSSQTSAR